MAGNAFFVIGKKLFKEMRCGKVRTKFHLLNRRDRLVTAAMPSYVHMRMEKNLESEKGASQKRGNSKKTVASSTCSSRAC